MNDEVTNPLMRETGAMAGDDGHGWDYAVLDLSNGPPSVQFSNGQPAWGSINGKRLGWQNLNRAFARLADDGWLLAGVEHNTAPRIFHASMRPSAYRYRRPAPEVPFLYREVICGCTGRDLRFYPQIVAEVEAAFSQLPAMIESCLEPYLREDWKPDPYPSALEPQLVSPLVKRWTRWTIRAVKVRLRRAASAPGSGSHGSPSPLAAANGEGTG